MYVLQVEQLERSVLAERQIAAVFRAQGGEVEMPSLADARAQWDDALVEPPERLSDAQQLLRRWGVR